MDGGARPSYLAPMLRKLLIALLTLCLAAPAVALQACHAMPAATMPVAQAAMAGHDGAHHMPAKAPENEPLDELRLSHGCLGCAASMGSQPAFLPRATAAANLWSMPIGHVSTLNHGPETPPPRA